MLQAHKGEIEKLIVKHSDELNNAKSQVGVKHEELIVKHKKEIENLMKTHEQDKKTSISTLETKHADALSKQVTAIEAIKKAHAEKTNLVEQLENEQKNLNCHTESWPKIILYINILVCSSVRPCVGVCGCAIPHWNRLGPHMNV